MYLNALLDVYTLIVLKEKMMKSDMNKDTRAKKDAQRKTSTLVPSYSITDYSTWSRGYSFHIYSKAKSILSNAYSELGREINPANVKKPLNL